MSTAEPENGVKETIVDSISSHMKLMRTSDDIKSRIDVLNEELISKGEDVFFRELPVEVMRLTEVILNEPLFCMTSQELMEELYGSVKSYVSTIIKCVDSTKEFVKDTRKDYESWVKKQKKEMKKESTKRSTPSTSSSEGSRKGTEKRQHNFFLPTHCSIPQNSKMQALVECVKLELNTTSEIIRSMKIWISLKIPRIEDGNNYGVSVQEEYIIALDSMEEVISNFFSFILTYFSDRTNYIDTIIDFPEVEDLQMALVKFDEWNIWQFRFCLMECRNSLALLFDNIGKNMNWLYAPRMETDVQQMFI